MKEMKNFTKPELNSQETPPVSSYKTYAIFITHSRDVPTFLESPQEIFKAKPSCDIDSEFIFFIPFSLLQLPVNS